ncbi:MAG: HNH endonuclease family protein [Actinomycetaceae bacterium]|nr:HNH endonuclease family protein [Actinomycetaceae bacterium]
MRNRIADLVTIAVIIVVGVWIVAALMPGGLPSLWRSQIDDVPPSTVRVELEKLSVRSSNDAPSYQRHRFGQPWADEDANGCDTRNDVLGRDLQAVRYGKKYPPQCVVESGVLVDPYTSRTIDFVRGPETSPVVQIDHVVALYDAWRSGAWEWDDEKRRAFANDQNNLLAVDGKVNKDKGHAAADQWLPPNEDYHCAYVARQVRIKAAWGLTVTRSERQAMIDVLAECPVMN